MKIQKLLIERIGEERLNSQGYLMKIIKYENTNNITIQFQDKNKALVDNVYSNFLKGLIKNPCFVELSNRIGGLKWHRLDLKNNQKNG